MSDENRNRFGFDKQINISNIISMIMLMGIIINYGSQAVTYLRNMDYKVTIMWTQFKKDHPELVEYADIIR